MIKKNRIQLTLENLLNVLPENIYWLDNEMTILGCNETQAKILGLKSSKDIIGKKIFDFQPKEIAKIIIKNNLKVMKSKKVIIFEEKFISKNGSINYFLSKKSPILDENKKVIGIIGISSNISKQKKESKFNIDLILNLISHMPGHVYWQNKEGIILGCNDEQAKSLGFKNVQEVVGKNAYNLIEKNQSIKLKAINDTIINSGIQKVYQEEMTFNNTVKKFITHKTPLKDINNKIIGILGVSLDITDLKNLQDKLSNEMKISESIKNSNIEILSTVFHEVRNKLGNIVISLNNIFSKNEKLTKNNLEILNDIYDESKSGIKNIDYLLKLIYVDKNGININYSKCNIEVFIKNLIENFSNNKKNIKINKYLTKKIPKTVKIDYHYLREIFEIIISNSIAYTKFNGEININVKLKKKYFNFYY